MDWNFSFIAHTEYLTKSPSLRGRGLKWGRDEEGNNDDWKSPSLRGRGLKYRDYSNEFVKVGVALFTRAWIEINIGQRTAKRESSRPLYEGVDWNVLQKKIKKYKKRSPSLRGRGLKFFVVQIILFRCMVALFTRAWIEIHRPSEPQRQCSVALFTRAWIEIFSSIAEYNAAVRRPLYEGVDWNKKQLGNRNPQQSRPLYEGVDWNRALQTYLEAPLGRPLYEGVDWNVTSRKW